MTKRHNGLAYLMLAPALILLIVFQFYPIIRGIPLAFTNYSVIGVTHWVGWANFIAAWQDPDFWIAMKNSVLYLLVVPPLQLGAIVLAVLVNRKLWGIQVFRTLYFIPVVTSMVAVAITWSWVLSSNGLLNALLRFSHLWMGTPIAWLDNPHIALYTLMTVTWWKGLGYYMLIYLAGLQSIPRDLEDAARIDGANSRQVVTRVVIPLLVPFVVLCSILSMMGAIRVFDEVYVMTSGGPANATLVSSLYIYQQAFQNFHFGYAAAMGIMVAFVVWILTLVIFWWGRRGGGMGYYG